MGNAAGKRAFLSSGVVRRDDTTFSLKDEGMSITATNSKHIESILSTYLGNPGLNHTIHS